MEANNNKALREALIAIQKLVQANIAADEFDDLEPLKEYVQIRDIYNTALAEPPRNCDVYDSYGDAIRAFEDAEDAEDYDEMAEWLLAPATEHEGENNESV